MKNIAEQKTLDKRRRIFIKKMVSYLQILGLHLHVGENNTSDKCIGITYSASGTSFIVKLTLCEPNFYVFLY